MKTTQKKNSRAKAVPRSLRGFWNTKDQKTLKAFIDCLDADGIAALWRSKFKSNIAWSTPEAERRKLYKKTLLKRINELSMSDVRKAAGVYISETFILPSKVNAAKKIIPF